MSYCNIGDKPKVYFQFGNGKEEIYQSNESPIDVSIENFSLDTENYSPTGYRIEWYSTNNGVPLALTVRDYQIVDTGSGNGVYRYVLYAMRCGDAEMFEFGNIDINQFGVNPAIVCSTSKPERLKARLHIRKSGSTTDIFTAVGDRPGKFRVACSDCPPGTCRCECDHYPGYCCLPCNEVKGNIRAITELVKRLNHG
ncbi:hypothetical protein NIES2100_21310 [Calothrix sp. NIES-2100]|uniref:hypothetical protein n=1 Tax=Calothrix sp. NIES-2100 TaxID=1954172 RepID=UPI000B5F6DD2|nr:hypothetical protein NIES2100_21310 [Calothrix sp. NIES-2100]